jgi:hypothetical protein
VKHKSVLFLLILTLVACAAAGTGWYHAFVSSRELRVGELEPLAALLKENQELLRGLYAAATTDTGSSLLGTYLARIRAEGVAKHADMKQQLDRIAENNAGIVALINVYTPHAKTEAFNAEADKFRRYAIAWRDRWNSAMELFMAGGNYPVAEVSFPKELLSAVEAELAAAK